jgi:NAD(P)-dependent dehydrogenase (short-subunit alcohol dehydrogenase family)
MQTNGHRPLAVVTGASSGIGLEPAKQFAANGFDLIAAAALNAGVGQGGPFKDNELADERSRSRSRCARSSRTRT